jgi:hypothetical protein
VDKPSYRMEKQMVNIVTTVIQMFNPDSEYTTSAQFREAPTLLGLLNCRVVMSRLEAATCGLAP